MANDTHEIFVHLEGKKETVIVEASHDSTLLSALNDAGIAVTDDLHLFVGDWDEASSAADDEIESDDSHEPESLSSRICDCKFGVPAQIHCVRCVRVRVEVNYNGKLRRRAFSPAASIETATKWAHRAFRVDPTDSANFVLVLCDTNELLSVEALSQLLTDHSCKLCFDLVPKDRIEG